MALDVCAPECRYKVPELFERQIRIGSIVEVEVEDPDDANASGATASGGRARKTQWVPAKVIRLGHAALELRVHEALSY